jgi:hypothetical protein
MLCMEMEKSYYVVSYKPAFFALLKSNQTLRADVESGSADAENQRLVVAITQGGFGQDIVDDDRQTKERFLEYLFYSTGMDLPRTSETFDQYFELQPADEFIDLDEEI